MKNDSEIKKDVLDELMWQPTDCVTIRFVYLYCNC